VGPAVMAGSDIFVLIPPHLKHVATLPCEILRQCGVCVCVFS